MTGKLGDVLRKYRHMRELGIREMAKEIGVSYPTLHRIESGRVCDASTLKKILIWLL